VLRRRGTAVADDPTPGLDPGTRGTAGYAHDPQWPPKPLDRLDVYSKCGWQLLLPKHGNRERHTPSDDTNRGSMHLRTQPHHWELPRRWIRHPSEYSSHRDAGSRPGRRHDRLHLHPILALLGQKERTHGDGLAAVPMLEHIMRNLISPKALSVLRWLLTILAILSLSAWAFSWRWRMGMQLRTDDYMALSRGCLVFSYNYGVEWADHPGEPSAWIGRAHRSHPLLHWGSLEGYHPFGMVFSLAIPLWALALAFGAPAAWLWVKRRKLRPTDCQRCGYDLSATPGISKCPECGKATQWSPQT